MGITSIGKVGHSYSQNVKGLEDYYDHIDNNRIPVYRGIELDSDDLLRREVITQLICHFQLDFSKIEAQFKIRFHDYFVAELNQLHQMETDGLLSLTEQKITVLPAGRLLIRNVCMVFDRYLRKTEGQRFSKVI